MYLLKTLKSKSAIFYIIISKKYTILKSLQGLQEHQGHTHTQTKTRLKTSLRRSPDFTIQSLGSSGTQAANRAHLDSTKFLFSSKYFSQAKVPEKYGSQEIQSFRDGVCTFLGIRIFSRVNNLTFQTRKIVLSQQVLVLKHLRK